MTYQEMVKDVFIEHHYGMGMNTKELNEVMENLSIERMEKWLTKIGYDLIELFENLL